MNGGYVMLDFAGIANGDTVSGLYNRCNNAIKSGKPIFISNLDISVYTCSHVLATHYAPTSDDVLSLGVATTLDGVGINIDISVSNTDVVTIE